MVLNNSEKGLNFMIPYGLVKRKVETLSYEAYTLLQVVEDGNIYGRESGVLQESWSMMRLPPASPFDNFLKAAGAGR